MIRAVGTAVAAMCLLAPAGRAVTPRPADWTYSTRPPSPQREPPRTPFDPIVVPTSGAPALVHWGEPLQVVVALGGGRRAGRPQDWRVRLLTSLPGPRGQVIGQPVGLRFDLPVVRVEPGPAPGLARLTTRVSSLAPRETYHLEVTGPAGLRGRRVHAVRLLGAPGAPGQPIRIAVVADHQLRDPSTEFADADRNNKSYPHRGDSAAEDMLLQQVGELAFRDPDFVLHLGDLVFGTDYRRELPEALSLWWTRPLATFFVPGNHDGMALYELALKSDWWVDALGSVRCARYVIDGEASAEKVFAMLACLIGDLKEMLFQDLAQDGLDHWRRLLGPASYDFDLGGVRFVGLNTYEGSPERRHGFVLGLDALGIDLGVPTVDNYGGFLVPDRLAWLAEGLATARREGLRVLVFMHHDPRGNREGPWGQRYHVNLPFPTEPLGLRPFQEWNYEGNPDWDSDPGDSVAGETQRDNSAVRLLRLLATGADAVFTGHVHSDDDRLLAAGAELTAGSGILTDRPLRFVRVTTGGARPGGDGAYWGYRLLKASADGIGDPAYRPGRGLPSVPAGNLWVAGEGVPAGRLLPGAPADLVYVIRNGLPESVDGLLRAYLDAAPRGYRFSAEGARDPIRLRDVGVGPAGSNIYYLRVTAPAAPEAPFPPPGGSEPVIRVRARRAVDNRVPVVDFERSVDVPAPGQPVTFDASPTRDPDGDELIVIGWDFGDGHTARGKQVVHAFEAPGVYQVRLRATDANGAYASYTEGVRVEPGVACSAAGSLGSGPLVWAVMVLLLGRVRRRGFGSKT